MHHQLDLNVKLTNGIMYVDKPEGISTHAPDPGHLGFCEFLQERLQTDLFVVHRLDKTTSGAMAFATTSKIAEEIRQAFEAKKVGKKYWFLTASQPVESHFEASSEISKSGKTFLSDLKSPNSNARTVFTRVKRSPFFELWQAEPQSGKPHQVRLHARDCGMPILGDTLYGGKPFSRLCLHSMEIQFPGEPKWSSPAPRLFERLGLLKDPETAAMLTAIDRRQRLYQFLKRPQQTMRLLDGESDGLTLDFLGEVLWLSWFRDKEFDPSWTERMALLGRMMNRPVLVQERPDRGAAKSSGRKIILGDVPETWQALEDQTAYEFRQSSGESAGLFLDQRLNRRHLRDISRDKEILNLFCYTGGFSLSALQGGARFATNVDLNRNVIDWCRKNHELNGVSDRAEFFSSESLFFLDRSKNKNRQWDIVVCDPPIFGRTEKGTFRIEQDLRKLLQACRDVLRPHGVIFFSTHFSKWSSEGLQREIERLFPKATVKTGKVDLDYALSQPLKSYWIHF